jgi:hypothetical protein
MVGMRTHSGYTDRLEGRKCSLSQQFGSLYHVANKRRNNNCGENLARHLERIPSSVLDEQREKNQQIHEKHAEKHAVQLVNFLRHESIVRPHVASSSNVDHTKFVITVTRHRSTFSIVSADPPALLRRAHGSI